MIKLESNDGATFEVDEEVMSISSTIKNLLESADDDMESENIPLQNITGKTLGKVLEYCNYHHQKKDDNSEVVLWDVNYCNVDHNTLFEVLVAANYLDIKPLLDLICKSIANMIKGHTPEEIRKIFNIKNDFTPDEEEQIKKEYEWCKDL